MTIPIAESILEAREETRIVMETMKTMTLAELEALKKLVVAELKKKTN